jgi:hypothetical protein
MRLDVSNNHIVDVGLIELRNALQKNVILTNLNVHGNAFSRGWAQGFHWRLTLSEWSAFLLT